ncbi:MAG: hypothetical protein IPG64_16040 [Haliea sp.]|nr:hypothetical protein [Haliea sp.]
MSSPQAQRNTLQHSRPLKIINAVQRRLFDYEFLGWSIWTSASRRCWSATIPSLRTTLRSCWLS